MRITWGLIYRQKNSPLLSEENAEDEKISRGTTSVCRSLAIATFTSVSQHSRSVTGTPVAAYLKMFGALLAGGILQKFRHCLAPTDSSLKTFDLLTCSCSNAFTVNNCITKISASQDFTRKNHKIKMKKLLTKALRYDIINRRLMWAFLSAPKNAARISESIMKERCFSCTQ